MSKKVKKPRANQKLKAKKNKARAAARSRSGNTRVDRYNKANAMAMEALHRQGFEGILADVLQGPNTFDINPSKSGTRYN